MPISTRDFDGSDDGLELSAPEGKGKRPKKAKRSKPDDSWLNEVIEEPRSGTPLAETLIRREKWTRRYLIVCAVMAPIFALAWFTSLGQTATVEEPSETAAAADRVRAEAAVAIEEWLVSGEAPITGGKILQWEETVDLPTVEADPAADIEAGPSMQAVRFLVNQPAAEGREPAIYEAEVLIASRDSGEVTVVGYPSLAPVLPALDMGKVERWPTLEKDSSPSEEVDAAIEDWASAYTSGSAQRLRAVINDNEPTRTYVPYNNVRLESITTGETGVVKWTNPDSDNEDPIPTRIVVAVTLTMSDRLEECSNCPAPVVEFDVLVEAANTVTPRVVAWGAPGTGAVMKPYQNAIPSNPGVNGALEELLDDAVEPAPEETEAPEDTTEPKKGKGKGKKS